MMAPNTTIENILVDGQQVTARFSSTNSQAKYEAMLDGWLNWKAVPNPATFSDVNPGTRTLTVRAISRKGVADPTPATKQFVVAATTPEPPPPPPPPPTSGWKPKWSAAKIADWDTKLIELYPATITDTSNGTRLFIPGPDQHRAGGRCELQSHRDEHGGCAIPGKQAYEWEVFIPASTKLSTATTNGNNTICQLHADVSSYTGGVSVRPNGDIVVRSGGGKWVGPGTNQYASMVEVVFGKLPRDSFHRIRVEANWQKDSSGWIRASLDGGAWFGKSAVATAPATSSNQMFRVGWYPAADLPGNQEMIVRNVKCESPA